jgi:flagellar hook-length control protein FliK
MTTVSSPNADIAHQARTAANRASSSSTTAKSSDQPADPFAALFDAAMLLQTDPSLAAAVPAVPVGKDAAAEPGVAEDESLVTETPIDPATLLASLPWSVPTEPVAVPVPVAATTPDVGDATDDAAGLDATAALPVAVADLSPAVPTVLAAAAPAAAAVAELIPGNQLASGVRRAGQALGTTTLGVQARTDSASAADAEPETGKAAVADSIDPTSLGASTALELAAAANAAAAAASRNPTASTSDSAIAPSGGLVGETTGASATAATAGAPALARHEIPTVPGAPVPLHAQQLQTRVDDAVRWMSNQSIQTAEIRVTPDDLGPITVHLRMDGDVANVSFSSDHAQTRQALEASMGGLRAALSDSGLQLGQAQVGSEQQNQQAFQAFANSGGEDRRARQAAAAADRMQATVNALGQRAPTPAQSGTSLVDLYA